MSQSATMKICQSAKGQTKETCKDEKAFSSDEKPEKVSILASETKYKD